MMFVCKNHVKEGLKIFDTPHIKEVKKQTLLKRCSFCNNHSEYKIYFTTPVLKKYLKDYI